MAYSLNALIGRQDVFQATGIRSVSLAQEMALAPLIDAFWREHGLSSLPLLGQWDDAGGAKERLEPNTEFIELFAPMSAEGPIAYIEGESFGDAGTQASAVFKAGRLISGPIIDSNAICIALAQVGVVRTVSSDEFDALGLGRFRFTADWENAKD